MYVYEWLYEYNEENFFGMKIHTGTEMAAAS